MSHITGLPNDYLLDVMLGHGAMARPGAATGSEEEMRALVDAGATFSSRC